MLSREQLVALLRRRDGERRLGLVWERGEIEGDRARSDAFAACRLQPELKDGAGPWTNLVIEGDNLHALAWLRMGFTGRVKCTYIDPPYNTGAKDWVYNDHYVGKEDRWRHSMWLEFLFQRLVLARDLMAPDGVLLVSINDENRAKLELMADQALPGMRVGSLVWRTRDTTAAKQNNFSDVHEHILVFGREQFQFLGSEKERYKYKNPDNDPRGDWNTDPLTLAFDINDRPNLFYPLYDPGNDIWYPCDPDRVWCFATKSRLKAGQKTRSLAMEDQIAADLLVFPTAQRIIVWNSEQEVKDAIASGNVPVTPEIVSHCWMTDLILRSGSENESATVGPASRSSGTILKAMSRP